jgi:GNAT superfamily N-acetyltransferase
MTTTMAVNPALHVRDAAPDDNEALRAIAGAAPMEGDITLRVTREPDFFQLDRLEGTRWRVGVAESNGVVAGCVMVAARCAYLHGVERLTLYTGDLKVHPAMRGAGVADALSQWARDAAAEMAGRDAPVLLTILGGNHAMEQRTSGRGGMPRFARFATIRAHSIPLLFPRAVPNTDLRMSAAAAADIEEMGELWRRVAPLRQFAPVLTAESLTRWIARAPGLHISDYRLARDGSGRLVGFLAWWNQACFKQLRVLRYSPRLRAARTILNGAARLTNSTSLPDVGAALRYCTALHVCVPGDAPEVLQALVRTSCRELRASRYAFAMIGLDVRDPLRIALTGLIAQPTDVNAYVCTTGGDYRGPSLTDRPLHYEIALV